MSDTDDDDDQSNHSSDEGKHGAAASPSGWLSPSDLDRISDEAAPEIKRLIARIRAVRTAKESLRPSYQNFSRLSRAQQSALMKLRFRIERTFESFSLSSTPAPREPVPIADLVERVVHTLTPGDELQRRSELRARIEASAFATESFAPVNPYAQSMRRSLELLEDGVPVSELAQKLRDIGL